MKIPVSVHFESGGSHEVWVKWSKASSLKRVLKAVRVTFPRAKVKHIASWNYEKSYTPKK